MKKIMAKTLIGAFLVANLNFPVLAAETQTTTAGVTPDSILYSIDRAIENIQLSLTNDVLKQVELLTQMANERLAEAQQMANEDKEDLSVGAIEDAQEAQDQAEVVVADGQTDATTVQDGDKVQEELDKVEQADQQITEYSKNSIAVLTALLEKVPEQAKPAIQKAIALQTLKTTTMENLEEPTKALEAAQAEVKSIEDQIEAKKAEIKTTEEAIEAAKKADPMTTETASAIAAAQTKLDTAKTDLAALEAQLAAAKTTLDTAKEAMETANQTYKEAKKAIMADFKAAKAALNPGKGKGKDKKEEVKPAPTTDETNVATDGTNTTTKENKKDNNKKKEEVKKNENNGKSKNEDKKNLKDENKKKSNQDNDEDNDNNNDD